MEKGYIMFGGSRNKDSYLYIGAEVIVIRTGEPVFIEDIRSKHGDLLYVCSNGYTYRSSELKLV